MVKAREQLVAAQKQYGESKDVNDVSKIQRCKRYLDTTYDCVQKEFLQEKIDALEQQSVFARPEDVGISVEYLNPSFLVKKANGGFRLVTAFADVGRYAKPQPSLMPDVDSTLRKIGLWKHIIATDLTNAFYQIPLSKASMKYCGVACR